MEVRTTFLKDCAKEFRVARKEYEGVVRRMDDAMDNLSGNWNSTAKQMFYARYVNLHEYMEAFGKLVLEIAIDMESMAEKIENTDRKP